MAFAKKFVHNLRSDWKQKNKLWWECSQCKWKTEKEHKKCRRCKNKGTSAKDRECSPPPKHEFWQCRNCTFLKNDRDACLMCREIKPKYCAYPDIDPSMKSSYREQKMRKKNMSRTLLREGRSVRVAKQRKDDEDRALMYWKNIQQFCKQHKTHYVDNKFPDPGVQQGAGNVIWLPLKEVNLGSHNKIVIFDQASSGEDVLQGELDDCWFATALMVLGERHDLLQKVFLTKEVSDEGVFYLRLCKDGAWKTVLLDDRFPCYRDNHKLVYNQAPLDTNRNIQLWPLLIQKAAAKIHGGYKALCQGIIVEALAMVTGEPCDHIVLRELEDKKQIPKVKAHEIWSQLSEGKENKFLMGVSTPEKQLADDFENTGLEASHAFCVLNVREENDLRLIKLRTPWSRHRLKGCLENANSDVQTFVRSNHLQYGQREFWITLEELLKYFVSLGICKAREQLFEMRVQGSFPPTMNRPWKYVTFSLLDDTLVHLHLGLFQKNMRGKGAGAIEDFNDLLIVVLKNSLTQDYAPYLLEPLFTRVMSHSERRARSFVSCELSLQKGSYTVACLGFSQMQRSIEDLTEQEILKLNKDFTLVIHSSHDLIGIQEIDLTTISLLEYAPADALILLTKQLAQEKEDGQTDRRISELQSTQSGQKVSTYSLMWWGEIMVLENNTDFPCGYQRSYKASKYLLYSRKGQVTKDCVPPHTCQVIHVTTAMVPDVDWHVVAEKGFRLFSTGEPECHSPLIAEDVKGLHIPRPIPDL